MIYHFNTHYFLIWYFLELSGVLICTRRIGRWGGGIISVGVIIFLNLCSIFYSHFDFIVMGILIWIKVKTLLSPKSYCNNDLVIIIVIYIGNIIIRPIYSFEKPINLLPQVCVPMEFYVEIFGQKAPKMINTIVWDYAQTNQIKIHPYDNQDFYFYNYFTIISQYTPPPLPSLNSVQITYNQNTSNVDYYLSYHFFGMLIFSVILCIYFKCTSQYPGQVSIIFFK